MGNVRRIEVKLASLQDRILGKLGYREYSLSISGTQVDILPGITQKNITSYSPDQLSGFADRLGGQGNPISIFRLELSREVPESLVRQFGYWILSRDGYVADCLPLDIQVTDSRYIVLLGVIKQTANQP